MKLSFKLSEIDDTVPVYIGNLRILSIEILKLYRSLSPNIMRNLFKIRKLKKVTEESEFKK